VFIFLSLESVRLAFWLNPPPSVEEEKKDIGGLHFI
jgi:hypothetical protein